MPFRAPGLVPYPCVWWGGSPSLSRASRSERHCSKEKVGWRLSPPAQGRQSRTSQGDSKGQATGSFKSQICPSTSGTVVPSSLPLSSGQPGLLLPALLPQQAKPWLHHVTPTSTSVHGFIIPGRSIVVPKLPQLDTEEAIKYYGVILNT